MVNGADDWDLYLYILILISGYNEIEIEWTPNWDFFWIRSRASFRVEFELFVKFRFEYRLINTLRIYNLLKSWMKPGLDWYRETLKNGILDKNKVGFHDQ